MECFFYQVWDMKTKKLMCDLPGHADEVNCLVLILAAADDLILGHIFRTYKINYFIGIRSRLEPGWGESC